MIEVIRASEQQYPRRKRCLQSRFLIQLTSGGLVRHPAHEISYESHIVTTLWESVQKYDPSFSRATGRIGTRFCRVEQASPSAGPRKSLRHSGRSCFLWSITLSAKRTEEMDSISTQRPRSPFFHSFQTVLHRTRSPMKVLERFLFVHSQQLLAK